MQCCFYLDDLYLFITQPHLSKAIYNWAVKFRFWSKAQQWFSGLPGILAYNPTACWCFGKRCHLTAPGFVVRSWAWFTVFKEFFLCLQIYPISQKSMPGGGLMKIIDVNYSKVWVSVWMCVICVLSRVYSRLTSSLPGTGFESNSILNRIKCLLKLNEWIFWFLTTEPPLTYWQYKIILGPQKMHSFCTLWLLCISEWKLETGRKTFRSDIFGF